MSDIRRKMCSNKIKRLSNDFARCLSRDEQTCDLVAFSFLSFFLLVLTLVAGICLGDGSNPWAVGVCLDGPEGFGLSPSVVLTEPKVIKQSD